MNLKNLRYQGQATAQGEPAFTLVELVAVLAAVALLGLLALPALAGNKGKSKVMQCLNNIRQIGMGTALFTQENGYYPPLYRMSGVPGWPTWTYNSSAMVVKAGSSVLFWQDTLRLEGYVKDISVFSCPLLTSPATNNNALGIGLNFPEIGMLVTYSSALPIKPTGVKKPSRTVVFGDSGSVTISSMNLNADGWVPDTAYDAARNAYYGGGSYYFRSPSDFFGFSNGDARMVPRHDGRVVTGWADGRADIIKNSQIGWQYAGTDSQALWSRSHN